MIWVWQKNNSEFALLLGNIIANEKIAFPSRTGQLRRRFASIRPIGHQMRQFSQQNSLLPQLLNYIIGHLHLFS